MDFFRTGQQPRSPTSPRARERLSTIAEDPATNNYKIAELPGSSPTSTLPRVSEETRPPSYTTKHEWQQAGANVPKNSGIFSRLRSRHGGFGKLLIVLLVLLVLIIGLAIGLGVGLTRKHSSSSSDSSSGSSSGSGTTSSSGIIQDFPLGQYTLSTALRDVETSCTSNSATWRCFPYSLYSGDNSTSGAALFNWQLTNYSSLFPSNATMETTDSNGIPANITVASLSDPFTIVVPSTNVTYFNNDTQPRYTFSFSFTATTSPSGSIDANNTAATCYYANTTFTATMYLSSSPEATYPGASIADSSYTSSAYTRWPYAVELVESVGGGTGIPSCYANSDTTESVGTFTTQSSSSQCQCVYSNY